ncbi:transcriptional regulator [Paenibacillus albidus]|uniref:Transcriptional regulator n=1 Tax=Paenibacillus albidus TaxID=2041023 RepID=A0A917FCN7_9BACL|nr:metalloregulator ArsR/SmtB family transcription factor [Paenibacillus albidus]GGF66600.1 transcriptional regulator [Paenibacillus albidus]
MGEPAFKPDVFQAVADPTRRRLLTLLADKEMPIAAISDCFPISRSAVNKHLHVLLDAGLLHSRRTGRETRYRLRPEPLAQLKDWLAFFDQYWDDKLALLKQYVESENE